MAKWVKQWKVWGSAKAPYVVSLGDDGTWACGCMAWTRSFPRKDCKHIAKIKDEESGADVMKLAKRVIESSPSSASLRRRVQSLAKTEKKEKTKVQVTVSVTSGNDKPTRRRFTFEDE